jgi:hypothetical protein
VLRAKAPQLAGTENRIYRLFDPHAHATGPGGVVEYTRLEHWDVARDQGRVAARTARERAEREKAEAAEE